MSDTEIIPVKFESLPAALAALDMLEKEIQRAPTLKILNEIMDAAKKIQQRWKAVKVVADRAGTCWAGAVTKLGKELKAIPKATGTRGNFAGSEPGKAGKGSGSGARSGGTKTNRRTSAPTDAEKGIKDKKLAAQARKLADIPDDERKDITARLIADGKPVTPNAVLAAKRAQNKADKRHELTVAAFSESGPFDVVVIDPPWRMSKIDRDERPNQDVFAYPVMTEDELKKFWPDEIAQQTSKDCHVFCWATQKHLPMTLRLLDAWGLKYVLTMVWHKDGGFQPFDLPQYNCEFVIYARKGSPLFVSTKAFNCCFNGKRREHSRKPDEFYDLIRRVTGGSRVDVFSRESREDFAQYGNEISKFKKVV